MIIGEVEAGKAALVQNLFETLDDDTVVAAQLVSTQLEAEETRSGPYGARSG